MGRRRGPAEIHHLVVHCSASPNGRWVTAADIDRWHAERGFTRDLSIAPTHAPALRHIGYHFVILTSGAVEVGRPLRETGAHVRGHNRSSIGTCLVGTDRFTAEQWTALAGHVRSLQRDFPVLQVVGHRDLSPDVDGDGEVERHEWLKTCPGFDVSQWVAGGMSPPAGYLLGWGELQAGGTR